MKKGIIKALAFFSIVFAMSNCSKNEEPKIDLQVTTAPVINVTAFTAKGGGAVFGTEPISKRGICWGREQSPTIDENVVADIDAVEGDYSLKMSILEPSTTYHVRAFAITTSNEVVYGDEVTFKTKEAVSHSESNCYIVATESEVIIPVSRANKSALGTQVSTSDKLSAELIWMDNMDVVDTVFTYGNGSSGNLVVLTGNVNGNAVVAAKVNNKIVWSWHIWVNENPSSIGTITLPSGEKIMDRNLGATEIGAVGLQYQFGRKDPFTASASLGTPSEILLYDLKGGNPVISTADGQKNLAFATANPLTFIKSNYVDWCDQDIRTWWVNEDGTKTVYDPSPEGWRIAAIENYIGIDDKSFDKNYEGGYNFIYNGQSNFFPFTGYREVNGALDATAIVGNLWVNSPIPGDVGAGAAFCVEYGIHGVFANGAPRARALCIRCVKEK